jgi:hypothetical protein
LFETFKPTKEEFDTCDRYELTYKSHEYDPSINSFSKQKAVMMDCWINLKHPGDSHPTWRQVCTLHQEELKIENMSASFRDTSAKLQYISVVLYFNTIFPELKKHVQISDVNMASMVATTRDKGSIDAATLVKNWGIGIEAAKRTLLVNTQRGVTRMIHPSLTKMFKPNNGHLRYCHLTIMMYNDTIHSTIA